MAAKLRKYWGVTTVDGIEVYNERYKIWPNSNTEELKKVLGIFGIKKSQIDEQSKEGITALYLKFNPNKMDSSDINAEALATRLESEIPWDEWRTIDVYYIDLSNPSKFDGWSSEEMAAYVEDHYNDMELSGILGANGETVGEDTFGMYLLKYGGQDFDVEVLSTKTTPVPVVSSSVYNRTTTYRSGIKTTLRYKRISGLNDDSPIVQAMVNESDSTRALSTMDWLNTISLTDDESQTGNLIWYDGKIRTSTVKDLKKIDYANLISGSVDTAYDKKKKKGGFFGFLAVVVAFVIAVIIVPGSFGALASMTLTEAAALVATFAIALSVESMVLGVMGEYGAAEFVGRWAKVVGFVSMALGIASAIQKIAAKAALTESLSTQVGFDLAGSAIEFSSTEIAVQAGKMTLSETMKYAVQGLTTQVGGITLGGLANSAIEYVTASWRNALSVMNKVVGYANKVITANKAEEIRGMESALRESNDELAALYDKDIAALGEWMTTSVTSTAEDPLELIDASYARKFNNIQIPFYYPAFGNNFRMKEPPKVDMELFKGYDFVQEVKV